MILAELKSLRWADLFLYSLLEPRALYRQINRNEPKSLALSFVIPAIVAITEILTLSLLGKQTPFFYYKVTYGWILLFLCQALAAVISASLMDMACQFFGWKGNIREFIVLINFSLFPKFFLLPLVYLFRVFHFAPLFFYTFFSLGLFVWSALIVIQGHLRDAFVQLRESCAGVPFPGDPCRHDSVLRIHSSRDLRDRIHCRVRAYLLPGSTFLTTTSEMK